MSRRRRGVRPIGVGDGELAQESGSAGQQASGPRAGRAGAWEVRARAHDFTIDYSESHLQGIDGISVTLRGYVATHVRRHLGVE
ncbi:hypothetical protein GCM10010339_62480 [Streptomyces alanosinicus]|uniref:Uncharacterized protein n=1 Tax=Streptomyces alanosinicus TaxID=68171 RepID=A0A918YNX8_9ACTN|nr:hypothetical protein GCM10010339_62480 [Streptomyces alanosinicus]